jgi:hypothetical protein
MAVFELTTFRLADGVDDARFLAADEAFRTGFLYQQPGLARATTARGDDDEWLIAVLWADDANADAAATQASPERDALEALTAPGSRAQHRYTLFD